jgi:hypothetical protein
MHVEQATLCLCSDDREAVQRLCLRPRPGISKCRHINRRQIALMGMPRLLSPFSPVHSYHPNAGTIECPTLSRPRQYELEIISARVLIAIGTLPEASAQAER